MGAGNLVAQESGSKRRPANRLIDQTSPYLLQHAYNPVQWHPWGNEAFEKARREDKPIFLSIGYSTCYWCHVMEVESFEDQEVAQVLNEHFVPIKVDREEFPDIDEHYMLATQLITQRGGWPNSVWLTPNAKPWMAGTYFPKAQFLRALRQLDLAWKNQRHEVDQQAKTLELRIQEIGRLHLDGPPPLEAKLIDRASQALIARFDGIHGGFGSAPKFPPHGGLRLLLRQFQQTGNEALLKPVTHSLDAMWLGGLHDHIGGGFHRYSTDERWLLPHFEKMLYDNAQLMALFAEAYQVTGRERFRKAVADIDDWVRREMTSDAGAFYSAQDAGEVGQEGDAYVWPLERLHQVLNGPDAELFAELYNFQPKGNYREQSTGEFTGKNIPHLLESLEVLLSRRQENPQELMDRLSRIRARLLAERQSWPQPRKDDKVLTSWNGLMIKALAHAGRVLQEPKYTQSAVRAAEFLLAHSVQGDSLMRSYRNGKAQIPGYLDDYAYFIDALLELRLATGDNRWTEQAVRWTGKMREQFEDRDQGGFFFTSAEHDGRVHRAKVVTGGGNIPNPIGGAVQVLMRLADQTGKIQYRESARRGLESMAGLMSRQPQSVEQLLLATTEYLSSQDRWAEGSASQDRRNRQAEWEKRDKPLAIRLLPPDAAFRPGSAGVLRMQITIDDGWHLYAQNPDAEFLVPTTIDVRSNELVAIGTIVSTAPQKSMDPVLKQEVATYTGRVDFEIPMTIASHAPAGELVLVLQLRTQACDDSRCLPPKTTVFQVPVRVAPVRVDTKH